MQIFTKLQKFNTVAFTLLSVLLIFLILLFISQHANEWIEKNEYDRSLFDGVASDRYIGNVTSSSAGPITYYHRAGEGDAKLDVRFIDMRDGRVLNISKDPAQPIYRLEILQHDAGNARGYIALLDMSAKGEGQRFDVVLGRFSDMTQITLAQNVSEMDAPSMLDENRLSTILWKKGEGASFNVFDLTSGKALVTESLGLKDPENERSQGAPRKPIID